MPGQHSQFALEKEQQCMFPKAVSNRPDFECQGHQMSLEGPKAQREPKLAPRADQLRLKRGGAGPS